MPSPWRIVMTAVVFCGSAFVRLPALAQTAADRALDQSQIVPTGPNPSSLPVNANGTALPVSSTNKREDDSFGEQVILKAQEHPKEFLLGGDASIFYTSNAALTSRDEISDMFFVANAGVSWNHPISPTLLFQAGARASIFRYNDTPELDFDNLAGGLGLVWSPPAFFGIALYGRYDITQLWDHHGNDLLTDNEFSAGLQKIVVLGRSHALSFNLGGSVGIADPKRSQRNLVGGGVSYVLRISRNLDAMAAYRLAIYFYCEGGRTELNQLASLSLNYHFNRWATLSAFASHGDNRANHSAFDYKVFTGGGGAGLTVQF
jgi:hypothetical protein